MRRFLQRLPKEGPSHTFEAIDGGYALVRRATADPDAFNALARQAIDLAGEEFVALPRTDGTAGYDQVIIIPFD